MAKEGNGRGDFAGSTRMSRGIYVKNNGKRLTEITREEVKRETVGRKVGAETARGQDRQIMWSSED